MKILIAEGLCVSYEGKRILEDITLEIDRGDFLVITGENGSGKTTLLKALLGLIPPSAGRIRHHNGYSPRKAGYLPQSGHKREAFPASCREIILSGFLGANPKGLFYTSEQRRRAKDISEKMGVADFFDKPFFLLSGGQQQRVLIARALCAADMALFLDEPATGLDRTSLKETARLLGELNGQGMAVVMITHESEMGALANKRLALNASAVNGSYKGGGKSAF